MYAQINYSQKLGNGPYSIGQAGCLLTSFSDLLERFGELVDPPTLNDYFIQHGKYVHDPSEPNGTLDNLSWGSISAYDGQIIVTGIGGASWPDSNDAIVEFRYRSPRSGQLTTHFCPVVDYSQGIILDAFDGVVKHNPYGNPVAWAKYERHAPQIVTPPPPPEVPTYSIENIPERVEELKINTHLWDMNQRTWPGLVNNPVAVGNAGTKFQTTQIAHHIVGGSYYLPIGSSNQGYNVVDCQDPTPDPTPPAPVVASPPAPKVYTDNTVDGIHYEVMPDAPKPMWVSKPGGIEKWSFKDVSHWRDFKSVEHLDYGTQVFLVGIALHPIPPSGAKYYMLDGDFGDFKKTGNVTNQCGFNYVDLSDTKPPALVATPAPAPAVVSPTVAPTPPANWKDSYKPFSKPVHYVATRDLTVEDLNDTNKQPNMPLKKYDGVNNQVDGVVSAYGTVTKNGVDYYRLRTNNDPKFDYWYCIPKIDPVTKVPLLLVMPTNPLTPVSKLSAARDTLQLTRSHFEEEASQFLDDIMPKWFKNKK